MQQLELSEDIMDRNVAQPDKELADLLAAFARAGRAVFVVDARDQGIVEVNVAGCEILGVTRDELIGRPWSSTAQQISLAQRDVAAAQLITIVPQAPAGWIRRPDTSRDTLTGLANRDALHERIAALEDKQSPDRLAVLFIDLDGFKQVNDTWGHVVGDRVLRVVAQRISACARASDLVVRYGGDEFLVVVEDSPGRRDLQQLARRIMRSVQMPIAVEGQQVSLSASIGIAEGLVAADTFDALIAEADRDMYRSKLHMQNPKRAASSA